MRKLNIYLDYNTQWGETVCILGSTTELGNWGEGNYVQLLYSQQSRWCIELSIANNVNTFDFSFVIVNNGNIVRRETGNIHTAILGSTQLTVMHCAWNDCSQKYFETSFFSNSIFKQTKNTPPTSQHLLMVNCLHVDQLHELVVSGSSKRLGAWDETKALSLSPYLYGKWLLAVDTEFAGEYKFALRNKESKRIIEWEEGENRFFECKSLESANVEELSYRKGHVNWKGAGVAIPIFSLRSEASFGIGEFSDIKLLVDWAKESHIKVIQTLPINDTTISYTWTDSYPYNAISVYALHPIYLGLRKYPLKDKVKNKKYAEKARVLNTLPCVNYAGVLALKADYVAELYKQDGEATMKIKAYKDFYKRNKHWLFPYACFCYLRDEYKTADMSNWGVSSNYDEKKLEDLVATNSEIQEIVAKIYFVQFLLHQQLTESRDYAHKNGVVLKGDIPIGISRDSVEAWIEPHLFNLDSQTGAPPDDFSKDGQNWGFPTYNWLEMEKDNYQWWVKRFVKMADYFDAYRIDHILGFFRIWEIPKTSVHGLLGHFSPAKPFSGNEIESWGLHFDEYQMTQALVHKEDVQYLFSEKAEDVVTTYLEAVDENYYRLKEEYNDQRKIQTYFAQKNEPSNIELRDRLYNICNEVLFIVDKKDTDKYHPRIALHETMRYQRLGREQQLALSRLHDNFFYHRHSQFWKEEAMKKLPTLIKATQMLCCGEDLGMVPDSVPSVMQELQILSLQIQRMPQELGVQFSNLSCLPYLSVATTSTHDMTPIRMWWQEDREKTQQYYIKELKLDGIAPLDCNAFISTQIVRNHLKSTAMLAVLPLQDWLAMSDKLRRENPTEERINIPAEPQHNWNYRMHLSLEKLIENKSFVETVRFLVEESDR